MNKPDLRHSKPIFQWIMTGTIHHLSTEMHILCFPVINSEHLEPFPPETSNNDLIMHTEWRRDQPVLKVLCEKALGNEHFAKGPVKRELRSSGT